jgi:uncharacterized protein YuzE
MKIQYFSDSDMLVIDFSNAPASGGGEDVAEGIVHFYDDDHKIVTIEISEASELVDLSEIRKNPALVVDDSGPPTEVYSVQTLAEKFGMAPRTLQQTIKVMREAGVDVGRQRSARAPILLTDVDRLAIEKWRQDHPVGRPAAKEEPATA